MKKDIWTVCDECRLAFQAKSPDAPFCSTCLEEMTDRGTYEKHCAWKEEG